MRFILLLTLTIFTTLHFAQVIPNKFNYQAVARDLNGEMLSNTSINVTISILSGSSTGTAEYEEEHFVTTNDFGLFYFKIGEGNVLTGQITTIDWDAQDHFLKVQVNGEELSNEQLVAVPYALQSLNTISIDGKEVSAANPTDGQVLVYNGNNGRWEAQTGSGTGDNWGTQTIVTDATLLGDGTSGNPLSGFDGDYSNLTNQPTIPTLTSQLSNDAGFLNTEVDGDITNELITGGALSGTNLEITDAGGTTTIDLSPLSASDNWGTQTVVTDVTLSGDGTSGNPLSGFDGDYTNLTNQPTIPTLTSQLSNDAGFLNTEIDGDITNELITGGTLSGTNLEITDAGGTTTIDLSTLSAGDNWGSDVVNTDASLTGDGTSSNPLIVNGDLTDDQLLTYVSGSQSLSISDGNTITLNVDDADANSTNEIQDLQLIGDDLSITNNGSATNIDLSPYKELPTTASTGDILKWNGSNWALSTDDVNDPDNDAANELQTLTLSGNTIAISTGNSINISANAPANNQVLGWNNTLGQWEAMNAPPNNLYNSDGTLAGNRVVSQAGNRLSFDATTVDGFNVANNTISVDGANQRMGVGLNTPLSTFEVNGDMAQTNATDRFLRGGDAADLIASAYGYVQIDGSNGGAGTNNFTVSQVSTGVYRIIYTGSRTFVNASDIVFTATPDASGSANIFMLNYEVTGTNQIDVNTYRMVTAVVLAGSTVATVDAPFSFELRIK